LAGTVGDDRYTGRVFPWCSHHGGCRRDRQAADSAPRGAPGPSPRRSQRPARHRSPNPPRPVPVGRLL